jgi:hypothetical protein
MSRNWLFCLGFGLRIKVEELNGLEVEDLKSFFKDDKLKRSINRIIIRATGATTTIDVNERFSLSNPEYRTLKVVDSGTTPKVRKNFVN